MEIKQMQIFKIKKNSSYECLSLIMIDSVIRVNKKYYLQTLFDNGSDTTF